MMSGALGEQVVIKEEEIQATQVPIVSLLSRTVVYSWLAITIIANGMEGYTLSYLEMLYPLTPGITIPLT